MSLCKCFFFENGLEMVHLNHFYKLSVICCIQEYSLKWFDIIVSIIFSLLLIVWDIDKGDYGIINAGGGDDVDDDDDGDANCEYGQDYEC